MIFSLKFPCTPLVAESYTEYLEELGALAITLSDQFDDPILEPLKNSMPLWPNVVIDALFADEITLKSALNFFQNLNLEVTREVISETDWQHKHMQQIKPMLFGGKLWVHPSWHDPHDGVCLLLDPGLAFGTGNHPTTALCLDYLASNNLTDKILIDYGCGSGILALAAIKLGAKHVYAVDIDDQALTATEYNAKKNGINASALTLMQPQHLLLPAIHDKVDLIIANILLLPLKTLKDKFAALLLNNGKLVVSGILKSQVDELITHYEGVFKVLECFIKEDWAVVEFSKV